MDQLNIEFNFQKFYVWLHQKCPRFVTITAGWVGHDISGQLSLLTSATIKGGWVGAKANYPQFTKFSVFLSLSYAKKVDIFFR